MHPLGFDDAWEKERAERERLRTRQGCEDQKYSALSMSIKVPFNSDSHNYAEMISSYLDSDRDSGFKKAGFPERLMRIHFGDFLERNAEDEKLKARLLAYCSCIVERTRHSTPINAPSFAMYGPPGTGKTFLATCVAKEAIWHGYKCRYTTVSSLAREVRSTFRRDSSGSEELILNKYAKIDLLVMDEIGAGTGSDHERAMFTDVISERYNAKRPTILISNLNLKDFKESLGERVTDRMSEDGGFILPVLGESRRRA